MRLNTEEIRKFLQYLTKYEKEYQPEIIEYIKKYYNTNSDESQADVIRQIYSCIGALNDENNIYKGFFNLVKDEFGLDKNILEVAGGCFPVVSKYIDEYQTKINSGTITVYDPRLVPTELGNIKLRKEKLEMKTDTSNYDLICSLSPCEATKLVVSKACVEKKDFVIGLCGCTHFDMPVFAFPSTNSWENYIYTLAKTQKDSSCEIEIKRLSKSYDYPYAIFVGKHK